MDPRSVVHRRVTADPSPFSPSFTFRQLLQTPSLFRRYSSRSFFTSRRESDPGKSHPSPFVRMQGEFLAVHPFCSRRQTLFLVLANLSGTRHHRALPCDCFLGRLCTSDMSPVVSFVQSRRQSSSFLDGRTGFSANRSGAEHRHALHCD
jgi:hypothetical protein